MFDLNPIAGNVFALLMQQFRQAAENRLPDTHALTIGLILTDGELNLLKSTQQTIIIQVLLKAFMVSRDRWRGTSHMYDVDM